MAWHGEENLTGKVVRLSSVRQGRDTIYYIQIAGQSKIFTADLSLSPKLPLVRPGDSVTGQYLNTRSIVVNFTSFDDLSMRLGGISPPTIQSLLLTRSPATAE